MDRIWCARVGLCALLVIGLASCGGGGDAATEQGPAGLSFSLQPADTVVDNIFNTAVVFRDAGGNVLPLNGLPVKLYLQSNPGGGVLLGDTDVNSKFGVCYFFSTLSINEPAPGYTLRAEWEGLSVVSEPFEILPIQVTSIAFQVEPSNTVVGETMDVSVELRDQTGSFLPQDGVEISLALIENPSGGNMSGQTLAQTVAGVAEFTLSFDTVGPGYRLRAVANTLVAASAVFEILPLPPTEILFVLQPVDVDKNEDFTVSVELKDETGSRVTTDGLNVTLSIQDNPGGGNLNGTKTVPSVSGLCTFSGLSIDADAVGYTLRASYGPLFDISNAFEVISTFDIPVWDSSYGGNTGNSCDDCGTLVSISGFQFPFFGANKSSFYVQSNGPLTFNGSDSDFSETVSEMQNDSVGRICGWWDDLNTGGGGTIYAKQDATRVVVTYINVPQLGGSGGANMQITLHATGRIDIYYQSMVSMSDGIIGISPGGGLKTAQSYNFDQTVYPNFTVVPTGSFPYEQFSSGGGDLHPNGWITFLPNGPSFDGSDGYSFTTG